ncbi:MAG: acyl-CoA/acyl-ACP dehydrogenase [Rhodothermales bacterium]|nr:acyl-CoA/acyl-ACP dehydrogenase [Rhodothermales bacterium]
MNGSSTALDPQTMTSNDIITLCHELGKRFKERAAKHDREGSFPEDDFADLKEAGLLSIMVPKEYGGFGADFVTYTRALEQLAMGCPSTALTYNMHNIAIGSISEVDLEAIPGRHGREMREFRDWIYKEVVEGQKIFASASSEPGIGAHFSKMTTKYEPVDGGYVINGKKSWVSMAGYADYYVVAARPPVVKSDIPPISFLLVESGNPGYEFKFNWDVLGMRSTSTNPMTLTDCFVPKDAMFLASEGLALFKLAREPHWTIGGYIGVYLGIATAAFNFTVEMLKKKKIPGTTMSKSEDPVIQARVGEMYSRLESARSVVYGAAHLIDTRRGTPEANAAIHNSKYIVSELGPWLTSWAIRLCGTTAIAKAFPLERLYRDSRCGGLMPATSDECLTYMGKSAFGADLSKPAETYW